MQKYWLVNKCKNTDPKITAAGVYFLHKDFLVWKSIELPCMYMCVCVCVYIYIYIWICELNRKSKSNDVQYEQMKSARKGQTQI